MSTESIDDLLGDAPAAKPAPVATPKEDVSDLLGDGPKKSAAKKPKKASGKAPAKPATATKPKKATKTAPKPAAKPKTAKKGKPVPKKTAAPAKAKKATPAAPVKRGNGRPAPITKSRFILPTTSGRTDTEVLAMVRKMPQPMLAIDFLDGMKMQRKIGRQQIKDLAAAKGAPFRLKTVEARVFIVPKK